MIQPSPDEATRQVLITFHTLETGRMRFDLQTAHECGRTLALDAWTYLRLSDNAEAAAERHVRYARNREDARALLGGRYNPILGPGYEAALREAFLNGYREGMHRTLGTRSAVKA